MHPIVCLITSRVQLDDQTPDGVIAQVREAVAAGVHLLQIRERDFDGRALFELTSRAVGVAKGTRTRIVVNDRLDVALAAGAHGVHLRQGSFPASRARVIVPAGFLIGQSVHDAAGVTTAVTHAADYLLFGNVFETTSKPGLPGKGLSALADVVRATRLPVLAVGGVTRERIPALLDAGAAGFAAISMFAGGH